jgi:hypothetical protein
VYSQARGFARRLQGRYAQGKESPKKQLNFALLTETCQNSPDTHYQLSTVHSPLFPACL